VNHDEDVEAYVAEAVAALRGHATDHSIEELQRRVEIADRQDWTCTWCGQPFSPADVGAGQTQIDHVIPFNRGGPRKPWNTELLHSGCNGSKGPTMTKKAWSLARLNGVDAVPPNPAGLRAAIEAIRVGLRGIPKHLEDYEGAGLQAPYLDELDDLVAAVRAAAEAIANARRSGAPADGLSLAESMLDLGDHR
jgi:hypothetical protein